MPAQARALALELVEVAELVELVEARVLVLAEEVADALEGLEHREAAVPWQALVQRPAPLRVLASQATASRALALQASPLNEQGLLPQPCALLS